MPAKRAPARTKAKKVAIRKAAPAKSSTHIKAKARTKAQAAGPTGDTTVTH